MHTVIRGAVSRNAAESQPSKNTLMPMTGKMDTLDLLLKEPGITMIIMMRHALLAFPSHMKAKPSQKHGEHQS